MLWTNVDLNHPLENIGSDIKDIFVAQLLKLLIKNQQSTKSREYFENQPQVVRMRLHRIFSVRGSIIIKVREDFY